MCIQDKTLGKIRQLGGDELLAKLIDLFLSQGKDRLAGLRTALDEGDLKATARLAHSLVSSTGNLGADTAMTDARALESAAEARDQAGSQAALARFRQSLENAMCRLAEIRDGLPSRR